MKIEEIQHHVEGLAYEAYAKRATPAAGRLRDAYRDVQRTYQSRGPTGRAAPKFGQAELRAAYIFGYHPNYCAMSAAIFRDLLPTINPPQHMRVLCLGAGPGAEAVGLTWALANAETPVQNLDLHLVDGEPGWAAYRRAVRPVFGSGGDSPRINWYDDHASVDLQKPGSLKDLIPTVRAVDLVVLQNVLNELDSDARKGALTQIANLAGAGAQVLCIENAPSVLSCLRGLTGFSEVDEVALRSAKALQSTSQVAELVGPLTGNQFEHRAKLLRVDERAVTEDWHVDRDFAEDDEAESERSEPLLDPAEVERLEDHYAYHHDPDFDDWGR